jgi:hypothetical protein
MRAFLSGRFQILWSLHFLQRKMLPFQDSILRPLERKRTFWLLPPLDLLYVFLLDTSGFLPTETEMGSGEIANWQIPPTNLEKRQVEKSQAERRQVSEPQDIALIVVGALRDQEQTCAIGEPSALQFVLQGQSV